MADDELKEREEGRGARVAGTAIVAVGVVALIFVAAASAFILLGELLQGAWLLAGSALVVLVGAVWLANRLVRVAANQNKDPMG
ncbi:hypothetical protein [Gordonibacter massiliensis (ex Traore et al. 2017)]|uniref:Uncharacterized protein n=1 Tax=Gordonibacter massiliensis (ex Traore et al. 2017) TaxID=1841863 RepID=A0A842JG21_9ACTN|nr:hypothetical protein [Gordonibacter massiliensis (ex Traore et al. 2017)]MBC2890597.1 hypothetical protein [Gordonibacter massiliensis (ex Traore et al. 2017)]MBX9035088.1 hypothetical protein [Gordonibacter massiliensis (ex Traore et al. 2017)]